MQKNPNPLYVLLAITLMTGTLLAGCSDNSTTQTTTQTPDTSGITQSTVDTQTQSAATQMTQDYSTQTQADTQTQTQTQTQQTQAKVPVHVATKPTAPKPVVVTYTYKNNTYNESTTAYTPGGAEDVIFKFGLQNDVVTSVEIVSTPTNPRSPRYEENFISGIQQIVGMKLDSLGSFSAVNGASLTTGAFNDAVAQLKVDAKA